MNLSYFLICFGILICYGGLRTVRRRWMRGLFVLGMVVCVIQLCLTVFMPPTPHKTEQFAAVDSPSAQSIPDNKEQTNGLTGYFHAKLLSLQADRCVLEHLRETPLRPVTYILDLHKFLEGYKHLQSAQMAGQNNFGSASALFTQSFGDTESSLSPEETAAIRADKEDRLEVLCSAFGKWTESLAAKSTPEQKQIWDNFQASLEQEQQQ